MIKNMVNKRMPGIIRNNIKIIFLYLFIFLFFYVGIFESFHQGRGEWNTIYVRW